MRTLSVDCPAKLFTELREIAAQLGKEEYTPLEYDLWGVHLRLTDGSRPTSGHLVAASALAGQRDLAQHAEGRGAAYRRYRLVYLRPLKTYFWAEYRWRDEVGWVIRVTWRRIPKYYNPQLDVLRKSKTEVNHG